MRSARGSTGADAAHRPRGGTGFALSFRLTQARTLTLFGLVRMPHPATEHGTPLPAPAAPPGPPVSEVRRVVWRTSDVARVLALIALFLLAMQLFWRAHDALFIALLAVLIAIAIHTPAQWLSRWMPFRVAFVLTVAVFFGAFVGLMILLIPQVIDQVTQLAVQLPPAVESASQWLETRTGMRPDSDIAQRINQQLAEFVGRFGPLAFNFISVVIGSFAIVILAAFLAIQPRVYRELILRMMPPASRDDWARVYDTAGRNLRAWVIGKGLTMLATGVLVWVGLTLFEIPGALALAALAAFMELIPNLGPTIAAVPAVVAAFLVSPLTALYVAIYYFVLQQVQSAVAIPLVERRAVDIPPAALLIWQVMLALAFGLLALFVATPLLAVIVVAVRILYYEPREERQRWDRRDATVAAPAEVPITVE